MPNRFFDVAGDLSRQLSPWELERRGLPLDPPLFELAETIRFRSDIAGGVIVVPVHFVSDLASIPQPTCSAFMEPDNVRIELGAWVHDLLCVSKGSITLEDGRAVHVSSREAARILAHEAMGDLGANWTQRTGVYYAVALFGPQWA